jgi:hypothetical protein
MSSSLSLLILESLGRLFEEKKTAQKTDQKDTQKSEQKSSQCQCQIKNPN